MADAEGGPPVKKNPVASCLALAFTYRTAKLIRVYDAPLVTFFQVFIALGYIYGIFLLIVQRGFQTFELPTMSMQIIASDSNITDPTYVQGQLKLAFPDYCNASLTYYNYSTPTRVYDNAFCSGFYTVPEYSTYDSQHLWVYTFFQQRTWERQCPDAYEPTIVVNANVTPPQYVTFPYPVNCSNYFASKMNTFIYLAENTQVTLQPFLHRTGAKAVPADDLTIVSKGAVRSGLSLASPTGEITLLLGDIIAAAGASLDSPNRNSGGYGIEDVYSGNSKGWPRYRLTGMRILATVDMTNYHTNPLNSNVSATITFDMVSQGDWVQPPPSINRQGNPPSEDAMFTEKEWSGVERIGTFNVFSTIQCLLNIFVVILAVGSFVDSVAPMISPTFAKDKYDDEGERALVTAMLEKSADHGVPFDLDDLRIRMASGQLGESYETAILRLEKEIEDVAAGKDRLRMAAKTLAARLDMDGDEILDEKVEKPEPIMKLMSPDGADEIPLFAGEQVLGRGLGKHPTISRKQMMLTVEKDSLKAFARSLKGKGNSIPGVKRGDNPWRQLTEKGQSISIGDRLCMQYKKNGPGGKEEIINEYLYVPLDQLPEQRATLWTQLERTIKATFGGE